MKRLMVIAVVVICLSAEASLSPQLAHADGMIRCTQEDVKSGSCRIEVGGPGSGGQPGKPGRPGKPERGSVGQHRSSDQCGLYNPDGTCARYFPGLPTPPSDEPAVPAGAPEPVVLARVAVERMDLHAPDIGLWPDPLEELPTGAQLCGVAQLDVDPGSRSCYVGADHQDCDRVGVCDHGYCGGDEGDLGDG